MNWKNIGRRSGKTENKKIRNATAVKRGGVEFKSKLEAGVYNLLLQAGLKPQYEKKTFILFDAFDSVTPFYDKETDTQMRKRIKEGMTERSRLLAKKTAKVQGIKYTPDFYLRYKDIDVYIETKGFENDRFPIKKKMFRFLLDKIFNDTGQRSIFFEVYTLKQMYHAINILKDYAYRYSNRNNA